MSFLIYTADDIISSLEIIEKLLFPETDFWHDNYLKIQMGRKFFQIGNSFYCLVGEISSLSGTIDIFHNLSEKKF